MSRFSVQCMKQVKLDESANLCLLLLWFQVEFCSIKGDHRTFYRWKWAINKRLDSIGLLLSVSSFCTKRAKRPSKFSAKDKERSSPALSTLTMFWIGEVQNIASRSSCRVMTTLDLFFCVRAAGSGPGNVQSNMQPIWIDWNSITSIRFSNAH